MSPAHDLLRQLRILQDRRHQLARTKDHGGACEALDLAVSLVDSRDATELREALLVATNPASTPPVPVVYGPQDVAAVIGRDELVALAIAYGQACMSYGSNARSAEAYRACQRTWRELQAAVDRLCQAAPAYELGGGRTA